ncbi:hypothetical protein ABIF20_000500 [Bradyrhizobium japonicum]
MLREYPGISSAPMDALQLPFSQTDCTLDEIVLTVTGLPSDGATLRAGGLKHVAIGDILSIAELAGLSFSPASPRSGNQTPWQGSVIYVPQDSGRLPIPLLAELPLGLGADTPVAITALPSNGSVFLADGMTALWPGQVVTAAQLCGLTFRAAAGAVGQISLLRYCDSDRTFGGEALLVIGPNLPSSHRTGRDSAGDHSSGAPLAVALLLWAGLLSLKSKSASAAVNPDDLSMRVPVAVPSVAAGTVSHVFDQTGGLVPKQIAAAPGIVSPSAILAQPATTATGLVSSEADTTDQGPHHRIGSSSPQDFGSLKLYQSATLTAAGGPKSFEIANNAVLEIKGPSSATVSFDTGSGELILDQSARFHGVIQSSTQTSTPTSRTPLSPHDQIDLKDLPFTSSMSASVHYNSAANISTVDFGNGSKTVTLQFSGQDLNWIFKSDGTGGTIVADPPTTNPIVLENQLAGTPKSVWYVNPGQDSTKLEGFTTAISTNLGGTVQFKIDNLTGSPNYQIQIYRLGYYGGDGARLITTIQHQGTSVIAQPDPMTDDATGEADAGNWSVTDTWNIPTGTVSGVFVANVVQGTQVFQIPFVVKDPNSTSNIVFQTSDETWQAYNGWGGASLYGGGGPSAPPADKDGDEIVAGAAFAVSYNRPIMTRDGVGAFANQDDSLFTGEYPAIYWLEENGYDVSYISGMDTATNGALLLNHKVFMDAGHDEYWTDSQVANVQAAKAAGVNLMFLSGNEIFWQTQFAPSIDGSNTANRTLISYKDSHYQRLINPSGQGTGTFEAPTSFGGAAMPSNALTGTVFSVDESGSLGTITIPYDMSQLRFWRSTSVAGTQPGQTASLESGLLGYEWDSSPDNGFMPAGLIDVSSTTLQTDELNTEFGNVDTPGTATHNLVEYRDPTSGALVFGAGTVFWSWGLSNQHDASPDGSQTNTDPNVQQAMVNLFADMGVQPQTLQASLVIASASTDHTPPTSKITNASSTAVLEGQTVTVSGTATDVGGVVGGVQVSTDGGKTWHVTSGQIGTQTVNWSYTFNAPAPGTYDIETRAVDDSLNLETPAAGVSYSVSASSALSLFSSSTTPATANFSDPNGVEVGVRFTSTNNGQITGIRFYKGSLNTGAHVVDLWTASGALLATGTSTNETASGWQQVNFSSPVSIAAGATYVASYHMSNGNYSDTPFYFDTLQNPTNGSLSATTGGLYAYSSGSIFPKTVSTSGDNYWVDVVFKDTGGTAFPVLVTQTPDQNAVVGSAFALTLPAGTFNDPAGGALTYSATGLNGAALPSWLTFNAATQTFSGTPTSANIGTVGVQVSATDPANLSANETFNLAVTTAPASVSLFTASNTPTLIGLNDGKAIEVGVKFTSSAAGEITALKFYRSALDTGPDILDLWLSTGTLLASATFTNTAASGWQTVNLATPVSIAANATYVASYHTNGPYVATNNFFANAFSSGTLTAPSSASVSGGNGVYSYGGTSTTGIFPTSTFGAANYYTDVVFSSSTTTETPPVLVTQTPNQNAVVGSAFALTLSAGTFNDPDGGALTYSATGLNGAALPSWLTFNAATQTFSGTPTSANVGTISVQVSATDPANLSASETFNIAVTTTPASVSLFTASNTPTQTALNDGSPLEVGVKFTSSAAGLITALKFYRSAGDTGQDLLDLWSSTGTLLARTTFTNTTASGWQTVNLATPVSIVANTTYVASYHTNGAYVATNNFFNSAFSSGTLTAPSSASVSGGNGVYAYGGTSTTGIFPASTFGAANYYADVVFSSSTTTETPPVLVTQTPNQNAFVGLAFSKTLPAGTFNDPDGGALTYSATGLNGAALPTWMTFNAATQTFSGTPTSANIGTVGIQVTATDPAQLSASETFNIAVAADSPPVLVTQTPDQNAVAGSAFSLSLPAGTFNDPDGGALTYSATGLNGAALPTWLTFNAANRTFSGTPTSANVGTVGVQVSATDPANLSANETFNLAVTTAPASVSLFTASNTPAQTGLNDGSPLEVGVKFTSSVAGQITALKFYRSPGDTGTDLLDLWSSTGTNLASATFTNTTATGWQTVNLATPVSIAANTTYVASYHTNGAYAATSNFFANGPVSSGTLTAPSSASVSGGNGVYAYGGTSSVGLFPTNTFGASNYYADVLFHA